ncbi:MAG: OmpA-OmpF porin, family [Oceanotoga sp.]|uniref:outer membrane beta-barrel protein n=1 Tax=Oceanotoga sp. TaxID=2108366 RepID=UPI00264C350F|nr:outer membrane beta-barrel protein [Oceanotoga sp.]MDN5343263.1 OmpA-OmpF porin, family [Oceanotoga sp.]
MKKLMFILSAVLVMGSAFASNVEVLGGGTFNTYNYKLNDASEASVEDLTKGFGGYVGVAYTFWEGVGVEGGVDYFNSNYKKDDKKASENTFGPYAAVKYTYNFAEMPLSLNAKVGGAYYFNKLDDKINSVETERNGLGLIAGAGLGYNFTENFKVGLNGSYRLAKLADKDNKDNKMDFSGFRAGLEFSYEF